MVAASALAAVLALAVGGLLLWSGPGVMSAEPGPWEGVQHDPAIRVEQGDSAEAPQVNDWFVGGHSMGGVRACRLAPESEGLLLGSYCATDLSGTALSVLSIGGGQDGLSTPEKIAAARDILPADAAMEEIPEASRASFGNQGPQTARGSACSRISGGSRSPRP